MRARWAWIAVCLVSTPALAEPRTRLDLEIGFGAGFGASFAPSAACAPMAPSSFALTNMPSLAGETLLAQRVIDREWGLSEDSIYVEIDEPGWRSEGLALAMSVAVPGAGQTYVGEGSGLWFAAAEVVGWAAHVLWRRRANDLRDDAARLAGSPSDSSSAWSFERWSTSTQSETDELERLYAADREAFYDLIASDGRYLAGWSGDPASTRAAFKELRDDSDHHLTRVRWADTGIWLNHLVAAVDALRAARFHNLPLRRNLELKLKGAWDEGKPGMMAVLVRRF